MSTRKTIHQLAKKWQAIFQADWAADSGYETSLGEELLASGFKSDMFEMATEAFGQIPPVGDNTIGYLAQFTDPYMLGVTIASMVRQITYWDIDNPLDSPENRLWFTTAFARLGVISQPLGALTSIVIESTTGGFGLSPHALTLVSQTLTIKLPKAVTLVNHFGSGHTTTQTIAVSSERLQKILPVLTTLADDIDQVPLATDVGTWRITIKGAGGQATAQGSLLLGGDTELSEQIRAVLPFRELLLFDGAPDLIQRLVVKYEPDATTREQLVIDRRSHTVSLTQQHGATRVKLAITAETVGDLLDELEESLAENEFDSTPSKNASELQVTMRYRYASPEFASGTLSTEAPIYGWNDFAGELQRWLKEFAPNMLDARVFNRRRPQPGDLLYAQVVFHHGENPYSYLATANFAVGDRVKVPAGGRTMYGTIVAMDYFAPENAPYPPSQTKSILTLADPLDEAAGN